MATAEEEPLALKPHPDDTTEEETAAPTDDADASPQQARDSAETDASQTVAPPQPVPDEDGDLGKNDPSMLHRNDGRKTQRPPPGTNPYKVPTQLRKSAFMVNISPGTSREVVLSEHTTHRERLEAIRVGRAISSSSWASNTSGNDPHATRILSSQEPSHKLNASYVFKRIEVESDAQLLRHQLALAKIQEDDRVSAVFDDSKLKVQGGVQLPMMSRRSEDQEHSLQTSRTRTSDNKRILTSRKVDTENAAMLGRIYAARSNIGVGPRKCAEKESDRQSLLKRISRKPQHGPGLADKLRPQLGSAVDHLDTKQRRQADSSNSSFLPPIHSSQAERQAGFRLDVHHPTPFTDDKTLKTPKGPSVPETWLQQLCDNRKEPDGVDANESQRKQEKMAPSPPKAPYNNSSKQRSRGKKKPKDTATGQPPEGEEATPAKDATAEEGDVDEAEAPEKQLSSTFKVEDDTVEGAKSNNEGGQQPEAEDGSAEATTPAKKESEAPPAEEEDTKEGSSRGKSKKLRTHSAKQRALKEVDEEQQLRRSMTTKEAMAAMDLSHRVPRPPEMRISLARAAKGVPVAARDQPAADPNPGRTKLVFPPSPPKDGSNKKKSKDAEKKKEDDDATPQKDHPPAEEKQNEGTASSEAAAEMTPEEGSAEEAPAEKAETAEDQQSKAQGRGEKIRAARDYVATGRNQRDTDKATVRHRRDDSLERRQRQADHKALELSRKADGGAATRQERKDGEKQVREERAADIAAKREQRERRQREIERRNRDQAKAVEIRRKSTMPVTPNHRKRSSRNLLKKTSSTRQDTAEEEKEPKEDSDAVEEVQEGEPVTESEPAEEPNQQTVSSEDNAAAAKEDEAPTGTTEEGTDQASM